MHKAIGRRGIFVGRSRSATAALVGLCLAPLCQGAFAGDGPMRAVGANETDARALVEFWVVAQNRGWFEEYQAFYAADFVGLRRSGSTERTFDRAGWMAYRTRLFKRPMTVAVDEINVSRGEGETLVVLLRQSFRQGNYEDEGRKRLVLCPSPQGLRIAREEVLESRRIHAPEPVPAEGEPPGNSYENVQSKATHRLDLGEVWPEQSSGSPYFELTHGGYTWPQIVEALESSRARPATGAEECHEAQALASAACEVRQSRVLVAFTALGMPRFEVACLAQHGDWQTIDAHLGAARKKADCDLPCGELAKLFKKDRPRPGSPSPGQEGDRTMRILKAYCGQELEEVLESLVHEDASESVRKVLDAFPAEARTDLATRMLRTACRWADQGTLRQLALHGADLQINLGGPSCLHLGAARGKAGLVQVLLDHGADPQLKDYSGYTPFDRAVESRDPETVKRLFPTRSAATDMAKLVRRLVFGGWPIESDEDDGRMYEHKFENLYPDSRNVLDLLTATSPFVSIILAAEDGSKTGPSLQEEWEKVEAPLFANLIALGPVYPRLQAGQSADLVLGVCREAEARALLPVLRAIHPRIRLSQDSKAKPKEISCPRAQTAAVPTTASRKTTDGILSAVDWTGPFPGSDQTMVIARDKSGHLLDKSDRDGGSRCKDVLTRRGNSIVVVARCEEPGCTSPDQVKYRHVYTLVDGKIKLNSHRQLLKEGECDE